MTDVTKVPFHGGAIHAIKDGDAILIALRPACEAIGLDYSAQLKRLKSQPWARVVVTATQLDGDIQRRDVSFVDRRTFTMWLATVQTSRIDSDDARELLVAYQTEAADALDNYFHEGGAINPRATEHQINALIFQSRAQIELLQAAKGLIQSDHLEAKARIVIARGLGEHAEIDAARHPLYTQDFLKAKNLSQARMKSVAGVFGKRVKAAYILKHGCDPEQYPLNLSNGQVRYVNAYTEADRPLLDQVWDEHYAGVAS